VAELFRTDALKRLQCCLLNSFACAVGRRQDFAASVVQRKVLGDQGIVQARPCPLEGNPLSELVEKDLSIGTRAFGFSATLRRRALQRGLGRRDGATLSASTI